MNKFIGIVLINGLLITVYAQAPLFHAPDTIKANGVNIDVGYYGSPYVYDWNGDGKKDLIVGQFTSGKIRFYTNIGTNNNPVFSNYIFIKANGIDITLPSG